MRDQSKRGALVNIRKNVAAEHRKKIEEVERSQNK